jgi:ParB-like chromosome segregation protein Spo0J
VTFDQKRLKVVPIELVRANPWNPKVHSDTNPDFIKVVRSVQANGLRAPIVVREVPDDGSGAVYEVLDGEQRWRASAQLQLPKVIVYNEGELPDERAKALTIWYQQQVSFDEVLEARLAASLADFPDLALPYDDDELERLRNLAEFDFDQYADDEASTGEDAKVTRTLNLKLTERQWQTVRSWFDAAKEEGSNSDAETLVQAGIEYLQERGGAPE